MSTPFSVLLPIYHRDSAARFELAFHSSVNDQTLTPAQVVVVQDGPVHSELASAVDRLRRTAKTDVVLERLERNRGLATALDHGLAACRHEIVARMDADDISLPERFERQIEVMERGYDIVGTAMLEFDEDQSQVSGRRTPPLHHDDIVRYARFHDPFCHPTVMYRKPAVERAGGYLDLGLMEDYWLFARMLASGARAANLPDPLVMYRVGDGAYNRRGGLRQLRAELALQSEFRRSGFTSRREHVRNLLVRGGYRLVPVAIRKRLYQRFIATAAP